VRPGFFSVPHAIYIAGYVTIEYQDQEIKNQCGESNLVPPNILYRERIGTGRGEGGARCATKHLLAGFHHHLKLPNLLQIKTNMRALPGEVVRVQRQWNREYNAGEYDLVFDARPDQNPTRACTLGDHAGALNWATALAGAFPHYKYLGRIRPGLANSDIITESNTVLANMGKYSQIRNNCYTFVKKIYADEAA
jgi:hypothetical protein